MRLTHKKLKNMIKEVLGEDVQGATGMGSGDFSQSTRELGKTQGADPKERAVVTKLAQDLLAAAQKSNIRSGTVGTLLQKVFQELGRLQGTPKDQPGQGQKEEPLQEIDIFGTKEKRAQGQVDYYRNELEKVKAEASEIIKAVAYDPNAKGIDTDLQHRLLSFLRTYGPDSRLFARSDADFARTGEDTYREPR
tara:strand:+ start:4117 stop:4695 length:579 start_codon:yes stop_codon:yes gene_type:complete